MRSFYLRVRVLKHSLILRASAARARVFSNYCFNRHEDFDGQFLYE